MERKVKNVVFIGPGENLTTAVSPCCPTYASSVLAWCLSMRTAGWLSLSFKRHAFLRTTDTFSIVEIYIHYVCRWWGGGGSTRILHCTDEKTVIQQKAAVMGAKKTNGGKKGAKVAPVLNSQSTLNVF